MDAEVKKTGFFESTSNIVASISVIVALGAVVFAWGVTSANNVNDVSALEKDVAEIREIVIPLKPAIDTITGKLDRHVLDQILSQKEINLSLELVSGKQDRLKTLVTDEFAKTMTPKQVLEMMNWIDDEKKNCVLNSYVTPYEGPVRAMNRL